ncbi:MAG: hypothetical protein ACLFTR_03355 [Candidatus Woesearchaeota archaeon]
MVQVNIRDQEFYIDGYMKSNLDIILNEAIPAKWDALSLYTGREGVGKTTIAFQHAFYMDPTFCLDKVVFTPDQFITAIENAKPEDSIVWDEAITGADAKKHAQAIVIAVISKLTQIRKKRLKIPLCFPYLEMINKFFVSRCLYMIYVYAHDFKDRGYFRFYSQPKTETIRYLMKEKFAHSPRKAYSSVLSNFYGRATKFFPIDEAEYDDKKEWSRKELDKASSTWRERFIRTVLMVKKDDSIDLSVARIASEIGIARQTLYELLSNFEKSET